MSQIGRADLLRAIAKGCETELTIEDDGHSSWVYRRSSEVISTLSSFSKLPLAVQKAIGSDLNRNRIELVNRTPARSRLPLRMINGWSVVAQPPREVEKELHDLPAITSDDLVAISSDPMPYCDLEPWARVIPRLRRYSDEIAQGEIDWMKIVDGLVSSRVILRIPHKERRRWSQSLLLVLDFDQRLEPYRYDFHRLALHCSSISSTQGLDVRVLTDGPNGVLRNWVHPRIEGYSTRQELCMDTLAKRVRRQTTLVLATDLGEYAYDRKSEIQSQWLSWGKKMRQSGARLIVMAPIGRARIDREFLQIFEVVRWSSDGGFLQHGFHNAYSHAVPGSGGDIKKWDLIDQLLAMAALAVRVDPPLLRLMCSLLVPGGSIELEGHLWNHPHIERKALTCSVRPEFVDAHLARLGRFPKSLVDEAWNAIKRDHRHLRRSVNRVEELRHSVVGAESGGPKSEAMRFVRRLLHGLNEITLSWSDVQTHIGICKLIQEAAVGSVRAQDPELFAMLDDCLERWRTGRINHVNDPERQKDSGGWIQVGEQIQFVSGARHEMGQCLVSPFTFHNKTGSVWVKSGGEFHWLDIRRAIIPLRKEWLSYGEIELGAGPYRWNMRRRTVPPWVESAFQKNGQLYFCHTAPNGESIEWSSFGELACEVVPGQIFMGTDSYGLFADITIITHKRVSFRLRYIPAGIFKMGSPDGEGDEDEVPQHQVVLTRGFWLGDTPCTQALWSAVMGDDSLAFLNRSIADEYPVSNVGWNDVSAFLNRLKVILPSGCKPTLPTEACWEYAARAGTKTAYWWGDRPDDRRANWGRQHQGTTPVHRYEPNPWGLYDMHGNVWEWCEDDRRTYVAGEICNPIGSLNSHSRVSRGGSWFLGHREARSASRDKWAFDVRSPFQGFRIALELGY